MNLEDIRERLTRVDEQILKLLNDRLELTLRAGKLSHGVDKEKESEPAVMDDVQRVPLKLIRTEFSKRVFNDIMAECRGLQTENLKLVGFQGEHGSIDELVIGQLGAELVPIPCVQFNDVVEGMSAGCLDMGILPVENSVEGGVSEVNDLLIRYDLHIWGERLHPMNHALLTLPHTDMQSIKVVYSHPQILAQCSNFIAQNQFKTRPYHDAAGSAFMLRETQNHAAAVIAHPLCASLYNLAIAKENIADDPSNYTRFLLVSTSANPESPDGDKCSIAFATSNEFGALFSILKIFSDAQINLIRIESRPSQIEKGNYVFLVDFPGSIRDEPIKNLLKTVEAKSTLFKMLGCYKSAA
ncbi:MAG: bifunctional chorismate mutase/prephenate dehydratase [Candidatus Omnitrophota bacterium]